MHRSWVGIDNGLKGGIAGISEHPLNEPVKVLPIPVRKVDGLNQIDPIELISAIGHCINYSQRYTVVAERPQTFSKGVKAIRSTWMNFGVMVGALALADIDLVLVDPIEWQSEYWDPGTVECTKQASVQEAMELFPKVDLRPTARCKKASDGISDALLIAEWARRNLEHGKS